MEYADDGRHAAHPYPASGREHPPHVGSAVVRHHQQHQAPIMHDQPPSKRRRTSNNNMYCSEEDGDVGAGGDAFAFLSPSAAQPSVQPSSIISPDRYSSCSSTHVVPNATAMHLFSGEMGGTTTTMSNAAAPMQVTQDAAVSDVDEASHPPLEWWKHRPSNSSSSGSRTVVGGGADGGSGTRAVPSAVRCHVCNESQAPMLSIEQSNQHHASALQHQHGPTWRSSSAVAASMAVTLPTHQHQAQQQQQQQQQPIQKNSLLSYFQVRHSPSKSSPAATTSCVNASTAPHHTSAHYPSTATPSSSSSSLLTCSYCERPSCLSCSRNCESCSKNYCTFCSTVNYDEARAERIFCLDCDATAHAAAAEAARSGGCVDMEE